MSWKRTAYRLLRLHGDAETLVKRGPGALAQRAGRRAVRRPVYRAVNTLLRKLGL